MADQKTKSGEKTALRRRAEKQLQGEEAALAELTPEEIRRLVQELRVYQVELEIQNEELRQTQVNLEEARGRYSDLYDFAPVSYFTLDDSGRILEANLTAASLLGVERGNLIGKLLLQFVLREDTGVFNRFLPQVLENQDRQSCQVRLTGRFGEVEARLDGIPWRDAEGRTLCRVTATDISNLRALEGELLQHRDHLEQLVQERTASLEASRSEAAFLADLLENASQPFGVGLPDGRLRLSNAAFAQLLGYSQEEFAALNWVTDITPPEWREHEAANLEELQRTGRSVRYEKAYRRKDGSLVPVELLVHLRRDEQGQPSYYYAFITDITPRKRFEEALRTANAQLSALFEDSPLAIMHLDQEGTILRCNPACERMFGWNVAELVGRKIPMVPPEEMETARELLRRASQGERFIGIERRRLRKNGSLIDLSLSVAPMYDEAGTFAGIISITEDITPRKEAEAALRESQEHYHSLFSNMLNGFAYCQMHFEQGRPVDFTYLEVNDAFEDLTGLKNVVGKKVSEVIPGLRESEPELIEIYGRVASTGKPERFETYIESLKMWFSVSVYSPRREYFVALFEVISERKQAEEALKRAHDELEQRVRERTADLGRTVEQLQFEVEERLATEERLRQSEARFRSAFERSPVGAIIVDHNLGILRVNQAFCQIMGYSGEELASMNVADIAHPDDQAKNKEALQRFLTGELDLFRIEERNIRKDGTVIWIDLSVSAINPGDRSGYFLGIVQDITVKKAAEKALAQHTALVRDLYDNAPCGYHSLDSEGRFVQVNNTERAWLGYTREEMLGGMHFADLLTPASRETFRKSFPGFKERGWVSNLEFELLRRDGTTLLVLLNATAVTDEAGHYLMSRSSMVDITARRQALKALEAERRRFLDMLEKIPAYVALIGPDCTIPFANREFIRRFGDPENRRCYEYLFGIDSPCEGCNALEVFKTKTPQIREWTGPDGNHYQVHDHPFTDADGSPLILEMGVDISGLKDAQAGILRQSAVLSAINRVFREFLTCETEEELGRTSLTAAEELSGSAFGFIGEMNQAGHLDITAFSDPGWAACQLKEPGQERVKLFNLGLRGLIGKVITEDHAVIANDTAAHPAAAGLPPGHPPVTSYLGVPLRHGGKVIGLIALANKAGGGYTQADQEAVESLSLAIGEGLMRFRAETRVAFVSRLYLFMSQVNEVIVRVQDQTVLFQEFCRIAVEEGRFKMAWVGMVNAQGNAVKAVSHYGVADEYLDNIVISFREGPESRGPTGTAVRENRSEICNDIANDPRMAPWREEALNQGYRSSGAFPLRIGGKVVGVLAMYAGTPEFFTGEEVSLLESLANDVSFAMESLEREALRRQAEADLKTSEERLRDLTSRLINAQEAERKRLAIELHDDLGQSLMLLKLQVSEIEKLVPANQWQARESCKQVLDYINEIVENVRRLSRDLMPSLLQDLGLGMAVRHILESFCKHHDLECSWQIDEIQGLLATEQEVIIYRIFQESLTNISKHARATRVTATITKSPGALRFSIEDNGVGFNFQELSGRNPVEVGLGLSSIQERARMLNGALEIWSREGQGTRITLEVKLGS